MKPAAEERPLLIVVCAPPSGMVELSELPSLQRDQFLNYRLGRP